MDSRQLHPHAFTALSALFLCISATMFLQGWTYFATDTDVDGFHLLANGDVVLSSRLEAASAVPCSTMTT